MQKYSLLSGTDDEAKVSRLASVNALVAKLGGDPSKLGDSGPDAVEGENQDETEIEETE